MKEILSKYKKNIIVIFLVTVLIRILFAYPIFFDISRATGPGSDARNYIVLANNLLSKHQFSVYPEETGYREAARTPVYPLFIAFSFLLSGSREWFVLFLQSLLDAVIAGIVFLVAMVLLNNVHAAFFAGFLYTVHPHQSLYTTQILSEILFTFLLISTFVFFVFFLHNRKKYLLSFSGIALGIATLTRPISFYFFIPVLLIIFLVFRKSIKKIIFTAPIFLISFFLILSPWYMRNYITFKSFFLSAIGNWNIGYYNAGFVVASKENISLKDAQLVIEEEIKERYHISDESYIYASDNPEICRKIASYGFEIIRRNPGRYLLLHSAGIVHFFVPSEYAFMYKVFSSKGLEKAKCATAIGKNVLVGSLRGRIIASFTEFVNERVKKYPQWFSVVWLTVSIFQLFIYFLAIHGLKYFWRKKRILFSLFLLTIFYFAVIPGPIGDPRFRVPVEPLIVLLAGVGLARIKESEPEKLKKIQ